MTQISRVRETVFKPTSVQQRRQVSLSLGILNHFHRSKGMQRCFPQSEDFQLDDDEDWDHFSVSGASVDVVEYEEGVLGVVTSVLRFYCRLQGYGTFDLFE